MLSALLRLETGGRASRLSSMDCRLVRHCRVERRERDFDQVNLNDGKDG